MQPTNWTTSRRQFLIGGTAATAAVGLAKSSPGADSPGWIDAHVHVWTPDVERYRLASGFTRDSMQPPSFTPEELFGHCRPAGVARVVLIQMSFYQYDNAYMLDVLAEHAGIFSAVGIVDYRAGDLPRRMRELASRGVRGFRIHARGEGAGAWVDDPGMATMWRTAAAEGLAVCPLINPSDLPHVDALCAKFPDTTVVVDHFARVGMDGMITDDQTAALRRLARHPRAHLKTSAFYALGAKRPPYRDLLPMIRQVLDAFGPERLMWASDCPFQVQGEHTYAASIALVRDAPSDLLSDGDKHWLLRGTAEKVFF